MFYVVVLNPRTSEYLEISSCHTYQQSLDGLNELNNHYPNAPRLFITTIKPAQISKQRRQNILTGLENLNG